MYRHKFPIHIFCLQTQTGHILRFSSFQTFQTPSPNTPTHIMQLSTTGIKYTNLAQYILIRKLGLSNCRIGKYMEMVAIHRVKFAQKWRNVQQKVAHSFPPPWNTPPHKIFASAWLDHDRIIIGCKDNTLWELIVGKMPWEIRPIDLPQIALDPVFRLGIRTIKVNPTSLVFATGSSDSRSIVIMSSDRLDCVQKVQSHRDTILDCEWLSDSHLVTVGKGGEIKVHHCFPATGPSNMATLLAEYRHPEAPEFRCVKRMPMRQKYLVASIEGDLELFDSNRFSLVQGLSIPDQRSVRALNYNHYSSAFLAGGEGSINCYDARNNQIWAKIPFYDYRGIRSLSSDQQLITFATGSGKIAFADIRTLSIIPVDETSNFSSLDDSAIQTQARPLYITGKTSYWMFGGHVMPTDFYNEMFAPLPVEQAIFTHCYDPSGIRLFVGGGPSLASLDGCNLAILQ